MSVAAPVRLRIVNPNTTVSMTERIERRARATAGPGVLVDATNPASGPASLESHYDEAVAVPGLLDELRAAERLGYDGYVIACFGDPGLDAARELLAAPVVGIAEAALRTAGYLGGSFSVVTSVGRTVGPIRALARRYGVGARCAGVSACEMPVTDLDADPLAAHAVTSACERALARDGSEVLVLGCAAMAELAEPLSAELGVPVVDGVAAAVATVTGLVRQGLRTSKIGEYAAPPLTEPV